MKKLILILFVIVICSGCTKSVYEKCTVVRIDETKFLGMRVNTGVGYYCEIIDGVKQK